MACANEYVYLLDALNLFTQTQWLYNTPVTHLLTEGLLDLFPKEWLRALQCLENDELNDFVVRKTTKPEWSECLKTFVEKCRYIDRLPIIDIVLPTTVPKNFQIGLSSKKQHEIMCLAHLVNAECASRNIKVIVDLGAGLGYVCQLLYYLYGYKVLGLEKNQANVNAARNRQRKFYSDSLEHVKYSCCDLTCDSAELIETILKEEFGEKTDVCLIGLHACGDLSICASKILRDMKEARMLIVVPCCYHKLSISRRERDFDDPKMNATTEKQYFNNFPLSSCLKRVISNNNFDVGSFLRQPFLRLACQEPADRWYNMSTETHYQHSFYVLARAVLQLYATKNGFSLKKCTQKGTRKSQCLDFRSYIRDSLSRYTLQKSEKDSQFNIEAHEKNMIDLWEMHCDKLKLVEIYTGLQMMLQAPAESFVLQDRLCWMREQGLKAKIIPVMHRHLSPRAYAFVSQKG